jgi:DNA polymerase-3 subunit epsilon
MRQIALDTETTGREVAEGHRIIEIGCVELINRRITNRYYHQYLQPSRPIDSEAVAVHGITEEFLKDKPGFADIVEDLMAFIKGAELIIHNADFDVGFIDNELKRLKQGWNPVSYYCTVIDSLALARERHPGQKNSLDALCKRYHIDNSKRQLHGALLDAELLAEVYLTMTGGQVSLLAQSENTHSKGNAVIRRIPKERPALTLIKPTDEELQAHTKYLATLDKISGGKCLWQGS